MSVKKKAKEDLIQSRLQETPIAIVGLSGIFPQSKDLGTYWDNIVKEVDCITDVPPSRWSVEDYYDPDPKTPDKTYCKKGGFIPEIDFDPMEFGLPPNILEVTDVSQLLCLVMAKRVLADAGYGDGVEFNRESTGVILGVGGGQKMMSPLISRLQYPIWDKVLKSSGVEEKDREILIEKMKKAYVRWEENSFPGTLGNVISGRITNRLDLGGTNCVVDAACASSLSGVRMAVAELVERKCDMMITGGVDTDNSIYMYMCFSKTPAFTEKDRIQPFDGNSAGIMIGEGIGMLLLKRLEDAQKDNDKIYAVIKGIGSSSDGKFKSIYAPRSFGQGLALKRAYKDAGVSMDSIDILEAHGTGTVAGDLAEVTALKDVFSEATDQKQQIALGSVKSQIGHTKNAAGAASLVKMALSLYHGILPGTINVDQPNPDFKIEESPFYINRHSRPWVKAENASPRRAGVSAFGFGGTNFHFVLEEHPRPEDKSYRLHKTAQALIFSAASADDLLNNLKDAKQELVGDEAEKAFYRMSQETRRSDIPLKHARIGLVAKDPAEASEKIATALKTLEDKKEEESFDLAEGIFYRKQGIDPKGKVVALFSGQGSPYLNMGKDVVWNFPPLMEAYAKMDGLFQTSDRKNLSRIVFPPYAFSEETLDHQQKELQATENAQPAIGVFGMGLYKILKQAGFSPDFTAGHSFGELTALWASGAVNDEDYLFLAKSRGEAMQSPEDPNFDAGSMMAVVGKVKNLDNDLADFPNIRIANFNSNKQVVVAGPKDEILKAQDELKKKRYSTVVLGVSAAFHTPLVGHAQKPFAKAVKSVKFNKPQCPVYSNATSEPYPTKPKEMQQVLQEHILNSVHFTQEIENIAEAGGYFFVEFGPQGILTKLVQNILKGKPHMAVATNPDAKQPGDEQVRKAYVQLKVAGLSLGDFDPYQAEPKFEEKKNTKLAISLSGNNYLSEPTKKAFEDALADGHKIVQAKAVQTTKPIEYTHKPQAETKPPMPAQPTQEQNMTQKENKEDFLRISNEDSQRSFEQVQQGMEQFHRHQSESLGVHDRFLNFQSDYAKNFFDLMNRQMQLDPSDPRQNAFSDRISENIKAFQKHQEETLRIHEDYLRHQADYAKTAFEVIQRQGGGTGVKTLASMPKRQIEAPPQVQPQPVQPAAPAPVPEPPRTPVTKTVLPSQPAPPVAQVAKQVQGVSPEAIQTALMEIVSEKTGYLKDMLEMSMDMEADLGIDSIKRVEILYGIQEKLPELPEINPEDLAELRTLEQIADFMVSLTGSKTTSVQQAPPQPLQASQNAPQAVQGSQAPSGDRIKEGLFSVVAEKTGYPPEMLSPEMDMESDLGIDSIKRVEILYGIQEKLPELPEINPEDLAELRTLQQIVDYLIGLSGGQSEVQPEPQIVSAPKAPEQSGPQQKATASVSSEKISQGLFAVVAEKTGYPPEMLSPEMDMESDLGIDSIKRVEILYGIQEKLPELPEINPEDLAELRSLGQIVEYLNDLAGSTATTEPKSGQNAASSTSGISGEEVSKALYQVISEKTGYLVDMLEAEMDMEADLGVDSIKRVEILYAIQEKLPSLPEINPEELAEMRTLGQIVDKMIEMSQTVSSSVKKKLVN